MKKQFIVLALMVLAAGLVGPGAQAPESRLLRFPAIHGNQIVFTYAGDLFTVPATGGVARRLTSDVGFEMFARFSPDGKWLAFTGQYDGNTEVYVMPAEGGVPKRLTYTATLGRDDVSDRMGPNNIVMGWKNETQILFRSRRTEWNDFRGQLYLATVDGGPLEELPLPRGGFGTFSPDGTQFVYNRVFREFRTWKRYRGGQADDVWLHDFTTKTTTNLTNNPAQDIIPMWKGNKVYFASDRDEPDRMNLYSYDLGTKQTKKLTTFTEFDVKFPSLGDTAIVFENGGCIYRLDLATEQAEKVPITIAEDFDSGRASVVDVSRSITNYEIAPDGSRALFGARGDVFTVPAKFGPTRNLTPDAGRARAQLEVVAGRQVDLLHLGRDRRGRDLDRAAGRPGRGDPGHQGQRQLQVPAGLVAGQQEADVVRSQAAAALRRHRDEGRHAGRRGGGVRDHRLRVVAGQQVGCLRQAGSRHGPAIYLYSLESKQTVPATDAWFRVGAPAFSADGKLLFFVSARASTRRTGRRSSSTSTPTCRGSTS